MTEVLPDGNLVVSGSQEVRVNFELRPAHVAGIVRPRDISKDNTIPYEKIAEARISYGGRGRLSEVQQPGWGQQLYDASSRSEHGASAWPRRRRQDNALGKAAGNLPARGTSSSRCRPDDPGGARRRPRRSAHRRQGDAPRSLPPIADGAGRKPARYGADVEVRELRPS